MLELNETMLEAVSGGWGSRTTKKGKIEIKNSNKSTVEIEKNKLFGLNNSIDVLVAQSIDMGNTSVF
ncbi:MAG: hypothetical protein K2Y18_07865 [Alphaproteobacteria bacterium]|nr:hypothetical protein [Alphaproteobacteria bacterium]